MKRDKLEIIAIILDICADGANKTKIVYDANLNFRTVDSYLSLLIRNDLLYIEANNSVKLYRTTQKGFKLRQDLKRVQDMLSS